MIYFEICEYYFVLTRKHQVFTSSYPGHFQCVLRVIRDLSFFVTSSCPGHIKCLPRVIGDTSNVYFELSGPQQMFTLSYFGHINCLLWVIRDMSDVYLELTRTHQLLTSSCPEHIKCLLRVIRVKYEAIRRHCKLSDKIYISSH